MTATAVARRFKIGLVAVTVEAFDLVLRRRDDFEQPLQRLFGCCRGEAFRTEAQRPGGYDLASHGDVVLDT